MASRRRGARGTVPVLSSGEGGSRVGASGGGKEADVSARRIVGPRLTVRVKATSAAARENDGAAGMVISFADPWLI